MRFGSDQKAYFAFALFLAEMALAFALASSLLDAPQALRDRSSLVGLPSLRSGPAIFPILAKNEALRGLSPDFTGALRLPPVSALYDARPLAFNPPAGFLPSFLLQADVFTSSPSWQTA
jgi:hypothetical protein